MLVKALRPPKLGAVDEPLGKEPHDSVVGRGRPPVRAPRVGSCLTLRKELSEEMRADKARNLIGKGRWVESSGVREPRRTALPHGSQSRFLW